MKPFLVRFAVALILFCLACLACTPAEKQAAKTALDIANTICIVANAESSDANVQTVCGIEQTLMPDVKRLLDAHRKKMAATRCMGAVADAGASSAQTSGRADGGTP